MSSVPTRCPVKVAAWVHSDDGIFQCSLAEGHEGKHDAEGVFPDQHIFFFPGDRRSFVGEFVRCISSSTEGQCVLPMVHRGDHAY